MSSVNRRLLVTRALPALVKERVRRDYDAVFNDSDALFDGAELIQRVAGMDGILASLGTRFDADVIGALPDSVKIIASISVGYDHIDVAAAKDRGIIVTNTPDVLTDATADIALLLLLGAARRGGEGHEMVKNSAWDGWGLEYMLGKDVTGARLGILGMGRIGRAMAQRARAFGMEIHYHNRTRLAADLEQGAIYHDSLESLMGTSDFFSLHAASTPETRHIINKETLGYLPKGAVLINTARGDLVDDEALINALNTGGLFAAGLDVFEGEPAIHLGYRSLKNVFLLPHLGSATVNTRNAMGFRALDNLDAFFAGKTPRDCVT